MKKNFGRISNERERAAGGFAVNPMPLLEERFFMNFGPTSYSKTNPNEKDPNREGRRREILQKSAASQNLHNLIERGI